MDSDEDAPMGIPMTAEVAITIRPAVTADAGLLHELRPEALANHPDAFASV